MKNNHEDLTKVADALRDAGMPKMADVIYENMNQPRFIPEIGMELPNAYLMQSVPLGTVIIDLAGDVSQKLHDGWYWIGYKAGVQIDPVFPVTVLRWGVRSLTV